MESSGKVSVLRCRKCRKCVADGSCLLTIDAVHDVATECRVWHMDLNNLPTWILTSIHQARWTSGRLSCQHCGARLGGFNFVNLAKCPCGLDLTAHLCKSRLDQDCRRPASAGGSERESRAARLSVGAAAAAAAAREAPPPPAAHGCELRLTAAALWSWPREADPGFSSGGTVPSLTEPESSGGPVKTPCWMARALDYGGGSGAGTGQSESFSDSQLTPRLGAESRSGFVLPKPDTTAAGQSELEERPETTPVPEVYALRRRRPSLHSADEGEEETEEEAEQTATFRSLQLDRAVVTRIAPPRLSKREKNRLKSQRRKQRRRDRWIQSRLQEHTQGLMGNGTSSEDEYAAGAAAASESLTCAVCLDLFFSPYMCQPCGHVFCEPCLRTLAKNRAASTPCPLCRTLITQVLFQKELSHTMKTFFPKLYLSRKQDFQKASCARWPLPSTRKLFHIFGGFRRQHWPAGRRLFPHGGYGLGFLDTVNSRVWRVDADVLVYIRPVNWFIGLSVCCFLCFLLFSSY